MKWANALKMKNSACNVFQEAKKFHCPMKYFGLSASPKPERARSGLGRKTDTTDPKSATVPRQSFPV